MTLLRETRSALLLPGSGITSFCSEDIHTSRVVKTLFGQYVKYYECCHGNFKVHPMNRDAEIILVISLLRRQDYMVKN